MNYFQILSCSEALGTCCNDYGLVALFDIARKVFNLVQILAPIILITMTIIHFVKLAANPEMKDGMKRIYNMVMATLIIFFLPVFVDTVMNLMPGGENFQIATCWQQAAQSNHVVNALDTQYIDPNKNDRKSPVLTDPSAYDAGAVPNYQNGGSNGESASSDNGYVSNGTASATGQAIVAYASKFIGQRYVYGGSWNGEMPYTPTDCSGFVQGVFRHHGIKLNRTTSTQWADKSKFTLVSASDIRAGDLIMYDGHVGILTGNGAEIIHAKGSKWGVVKDKDYRKCSSHAILGIMRIKGVN